MKASTSIVLASLQMSARFFTGYVNTRKYMVDRGVDVDVCVYEMAHIHRSLANMVGHFRTTHADFLLYVDPDLSWHPRSVKRALQAGNHADVVCTALDTLRADERNEGATDIVNVEAAPFDFVLIRRSAIDKLCEREPALAFNDREATGHVAYDLFQPIERGLLFHSEHSSFFLRCRDAGLTLQQIREKPRAQPGA